MKSLAGTMLLGLSSYFLVVPPPPSLSFSSVIHDAVLLNIVRSHHTLFHVACLVPCKG